MPRERKVKFALWMMLLAALFAGFILLGNWQVRRYHLRLQLAHDIAARAYAAPVPAPGPEQWPRIAEGDEQYLHVRLHGRYLGTQTLVHGASAEGYGYWVMAPLRTERGFIVLVNRGYIPSELPETPVFAQTRPAGGETTVTGLLRTSEPRGGFLRRNDPAKNLWYSRDVAAIAAKQGLPAQQVAPYFVDADASDGTRWPAGGLTPLHIYNHSLGYAITWYALALGTLIAAIVTLGDKRRAARNPAA